MLGTKEPMMAPQGDWEPVQPFPEFATAGAFIPHNSPDGRLLVRYFRHMRDGSLTARAWFGPGAEGAPGRIHGGSVSAILDEALGAAVWVAGIPVVTVKLLVRFRRPLNVGSVTEIDTEITRTGKKLIHVRGKLSLYDGGLIAEAEAVYCRLPDCEIPGKLAQIMAERRAIRPV